MLIINMMYIYIESARDSIREATFNLASPDLARLDEPMAPLGLI